MERSFNGILRRRSEVLLHVAPRLLTLAAGVQTRALRELELFRVRLSRSRPNRSNGTSVSVSLNFVPGVHIVHAGNKYVHLLHPLL